MRRYGLLLASAMLAALSGCDGNGDGERLAPPAFDLTGYWVTTAMDCDVFSNDIPESELARLEAEFEDDVSQDPGTRVVQTGNDLVITDVDSGLQINGTILGDQVRYVYSEQRSVDGADVSIHVESEGTALDADTIAGTQELDWTITIQGEETITGGALCTGSTTRVSSPES